MLNENKVENKSFDTFVAVTESNHKGLLIKVSNMVHDLNMTGNYLQKFVPMQI